MPERGFSLIKAIWLLGDTYLHHSLPFPVLSYSALACGFYSLMYCPQQPLLCSSKTQEEEQGTYVATPLPLKKVGGRNEMPDTAIRQVIWGCSRSFAVNTSARRHCSNPYPVLGPSTPPYQSLSFLSSNMEQLLCL